MRRLTVLGLKIHPGSVWLRMLPNAVRVPEEVVRSFGIRTAPAREPNQPRTLNLAGSLAFDTNRLAHLHTRFVGEVVELGMISDSSEGTGSASAENAADPLR